MLLFAEWILPKGDVYEVWKQCRSNQTVYYSKIRREHETTNCCNGTHSMACIRIYYRDVELAQRDVLQGNTNYDPSIQT